MRKIQKALANIKIKHLEDTFQKAREIQEKAFNEKNVKFSDMI